MFENLQDRFGRVLKNVRGQGRLTEDNIKDTMREVRMALLEADVALPVVRGFVERVREKAMGEEVLNSLTPGQTLIKIVNDELVSLMGEANEGLDLSAQPPAVILMAGLQGSGKTTSVAKLARWLQEKAEEEGHGGELRRLPSRRHRAAQDPGRRGRGRVLSQQQRPEAGGHRPAGPRGGAQGAFSDVLIVDTAGRLHVDEAMMEEIKALHAAIAPVETLFVVDSMTGQDAANTAKAFDDALPLTGVVLTKTDGDARGGAALSIRQITGKPIKFLGVGEKTGALEPFHPDRVASRILGMGDVLSPGGGGTEQGRPGARPRSWPRSSRRARASIWRTFASSCEQMSNMGGMAGLMDKLPGMSEIPDQVKNQVNDKEMVKLIAIINSMTPQEREFPAVIKGSRKRRIAAGSGTQIQDVNRLLKQFTQMQKMMKKMKGGGMAKMMRGLKGRMPGGCRRAVCRRAGFPSEDFGSSEA